MSKQKFLLHEEFSKPLNREEFIKAKAKYLHCIKNNNYAIKETKNIFELIQNVKRSPEMVGTYQEISVFEALNRIGSDLVLLSGAEQLFDGEIKDLVPKTIFLSMGNTHGFDFEITTENSETTYGEAFNAAKSFCKHKLREAIKKLSKNWEANNPKEAVIFINSEMEEFLKSYKNKREIELEGRMTFHKVFCITNC